MKRVWTLVAAATLLGAAPMRAAMASPAARVLADGAVLSLSVVPATGRAQVVIGVDGDVTVQDFTLHNPDKIVVDVTGATLGLPSGDNYDHVVRGGILNVRYSQFKRNVVRIVVDLDAPREYTVQQVGGEIRISLAGTAPQFAAWRTGDQPLAHATVAVNAPDDASVMPAGAPAQPAASTAQPRDAAFGRVGSAAALPTAMAQRPQQPRITISWENADITDVLAAFAAFSGRTIIPSKDVKGNITAEIVNQPWDVAMRALLNANGFDAQEDSHGIIIVDTFEHIASRRTDEPLSTRTIRLNYVKAAQVQPLLAPRLSRDCGALATQGGSGRTMSGAGGTQVTGELTCPVRGAIVADSLTNSISITDVPSNLADLEAYARSLDIRQPQVNIKAKIIIVDRTQLDALGLRYDLATPSQFINDQNLIAKHDSGTASRILLGGNMMSAIANAQARVPSAALQLVYSTAFGNYSLTSFLEAMQQTSLSDIQAEPSATVLNNHLADLSSGRDIPLRTIDLSSGSAAGGGAAGGQSAFPRATVREKRVGIRLQVTPTVTNNRQVQMTLHVEQSSATAVGQDAYEFPIRSVDNVVLVGDGETAVMGGLTQTELTVTRTGIPILVDLPLIGRLFGVNQRTERKQDLLILITPHIVDDGASAATSPSR